MNLVLVSGRLAHRSDSQIAFHQSRHFGQKTLEEAGEPVFDQSAGFEYLDVAELACA